MLLWESEVIDRTQSDVDRVKELMAKRWEDFTAEEQTEWLSGLKGSINTSDLERIINNIMLLVEVLELPIDVVALPDIPGISFQAQLLDNVDKIRKGYFVRTTTPATPSIPLNTYSKWNDVEKILADVHDLLLSNFSYYCGGEIYAGNETGFLL